MTDPSPLKRLAAEWRDRAEERADEGALLDGGKLYMKVAAELEAALREYNNEQLTVAEAAEESGYAEKTIRKMVRDGRIPDSRSPDSREEIRIRRRDLPRKPGAERPPVEDAVAQHVDRVRGG